MKPKFYLTVMATFAIVCLISVKPMNAQSLVSPAAGATLDNGCNIASNPINWNFSWTRVFWARRYQIYVYHVGSSFPIINQYVSTNSFSYESFGYIINSNTSNWRWKVRCQTIFGNWLSWTAERSFVVEPLNTDCQVNCTPAQVSPANGAVLDNGCYEVFNELYWNFDWSDCSTTNRYHLQVNKSGKISPVLDINDFPGSWYTWVTYTPVNNSDLTGYSWKVRAVKDGIYGPWSASRSFSLEPINTDCPSYRAKSVSEENSIQVYPNPVADKLSIEISNQFKEGFSVNIFDQAGKTVFKEQYESSNINGFVDIEMTNYSPGIYFLQFVHGENNFIQKIIKQ